MLAYTLEWGAPVQVPDLKDLCVRGVRTSALCVINPVFRSANLYCAPTPYVFYPSPVLYSWMFRFVMIRLIFYLT